LPLPQSPGSLATRTRRPVRPLPTPWPLVAVTLVAAFVGVVALIALLPAQGPVWAWLGAHPWGVALAAAALTALWLAAWRSLPW
jgi:hypothetical protein